MTVTVERDRERSRAAVLLELLRSLRASLTLGEADPAHLAKYRAQLEPWVAWLDLLSDDPQEDRSRVRSELQELLRMLIDRSETTDEAATQALHEADKLKRRLREAAST